MINIRVKEILNYYSSEIRYGIYYNGKPIYLSTVNVYANKGIALNKLRENLKEWKVNPVTGRQEKGLIISEREFQAMFDQGILEIRPIA